MLLDVVVVAYWDVFQFDPVGVDVLERRPNSFGVDPGQVRQGEPCVDVFLPGAQLADAAHQVFIDGVVVFGDLEKYACDADPPFGGWGHADVAVGFVGDVADDEPCAVVEACEAHLEDGDVFFGDELSFEAAHFLTAFFFGADFFFTGAPSLIGATGFSGFGMNGAENSVSNWSMRTISTSNWNSSMSGNLTPGAGQ